MSLDEKLNGTERVGLPRESLIAFLRFVTNPRVFDRPESIEHAWRLRVDDFARFPGLRWANPLAP
jgi:predicted nucleic acid-binding protein